jgi:hypothetical protein
MFTVDKGQSAQVGWEIKVPEGLQAVVYRITATAGNFSDGEEAPLPVLTNRMLVTESLAPACACKHFPVVYIRQVVKFGTSRQYVEKPQSDP